MNKAEPGLYQLLLTEAIVQKLQELDSHLITQQAYLHTEEAPDRMALHLAKLIHTAIASVNKEERLKIGGELTQKLIQILVHSNQPNTDTLAHENLALPPRMLKAITAKRPDGSTDQIAEPIIDLLDTTLLTNAKGEPRIGSQIMSEIPSAQRIDLVMAFIRKSGIRPLMDALRFHCQSGKSLRVLTTTYTGSTEAAALEMLADIGAEIKISYDESHTRLHAKAWLFKRASGFSTAFIGSSNLTHSAQVDGLEWNARFSGSRNPDVINKVEAVFESYWCSDDFVVYDKEQFTKHTPRSKTNSPQVCLSPIEIRLEPFQERLLEQIELARAQGHHKNLLVSATGTGKTVMAAIDYLRLRTKLNRSRLLFIAHRKEILEQSMATFRHAMRDYEFGEIWVDGQRPTRFESVFASIQSLNAVGLTNLDPYHFDVVIIDEFHHAAASSYEKVLKHICPVELLGLTATPERSDDLSILDYFDGRIAAELRLWEAIDRHRLVPFAYYGIHDGQDLSKLPFRRGTGYDTEALTNVYTANDVWVRTVIKEASQRISDFNNVRALGFCVSVTHAKFMADRFNAEGIKATAIWSDTSSEDRKHALQQLANKAVNVLFSVDLFNEGVDVPSVDTLLMLRPTESPTLFLQQLGRGLRSHPNKSICTVLDFVGRQHQEFRFDKKYRGLLGGTRTQLQQQVENNFPYLPTGCHMELSLIARDIVLNSIQQAVPNKWQTKVQELKSLASSNTPISIDAYLNETGLDLEDIYSGNKNWTLLCRDAGISTHPAGPSEQELLRAVGRLLHVDDLDRLATYRRLLSTTEPPDLNSLSSRDKRYLKMMTASLFDQIASRHSTIQECLEILWKNPQVIQELTHLFKYLENKISHIARTSEALLDIPLSIHAQYTRIEILAAFDNSDHAKVSPWREGVRWLENAKVDLLLFTIDKTSGHFSPTTRYRDYAINRHLIHWESQSNTRSQSNTGQRYQNHVQMGTQIMLFSRVRSDERSFYFLGTANYVSHESEMPMAITWKLDHPLPTDLYTNFAAAA